MSIDFRHVRFWYIGRCKFRLHPCISNCLLFATLVSLVVGFKIWLFTMKNPGLKKAILIFLRNKIEEKFSQRVEKWIIINQLFVNILKKMTAWSYSKILTTKNIKKCFIFQPRFFTKFRKKSVKDSRKFLHFQNFVSLNYRLQKRDMPCSKNSRTWLKSNNASRPFNINYYKTGVKTFS